jgi:archaellum component FlaC
MPNVHDLTPKLLTEIRDEIRRSNERLEGIDGRLEGIDGRLEGIDGRLEGIDGRLEGIDGRLEGLDGRVAGLDKRVGRLEAGQARQHEQMKEILKVIDEHAGERIVDIERRLVVVEDRIGIER